MPESQALELTILRCGRCEALDPGPRELCPKCHSRDLRPHDVPGVGHLVSWTVIRRPPIGHEDEGPYAVSVVDLDAGVRVTGRLRVEANNPHVGCMVRCRERHGRVPIFEAEQP